MRRLLVSLSLGTVFAASAAAQCINLSSPGTQIVWTSADEEVSAQQALGFTYPNPLGGALPGGYTHCLVSTNGWIVLTDGVGTGNNPGTYTYGNTGNTNTGLGGGAGSFPLLAPYWGDGDTTGALAGEGVFFKASTGPGIPAEVTWIGHRDWNSAGTYPKKDFRVLIYDSGLIQYEYGAAFNVDSGSARYFGVSTRNGIATVPSQTPIGSSLGGSSGTSGMCFKTIPTGPVYLADHQITLIQNGTGGWDTVNSCGTPITIYPPPASVSVGAGCYDIPAVNNAVYQQWNDALPTTSLALASADLTGNAMTCIANPNGYTMVWIPGGATTGSTAYVPPTVGATSLPTTDDGSHLVATSPINTPYGVFTSIVVSHNGVITLGGTPNTTSFTVTGAGFAGHSAGTAFYTWYDWNDAETGSGTIKTEEVGGILYVTWDNVESFQFPAIADPSTFQYQIELATGNVSMVWQSISTIGNASSARSAIVGFHGKTASPDPGSMVLATALPLIQTKATERMALAIDVLPVVTLPSGDSVPLTWTVTNVPEASHIFPQARACNIVFSIGPAFVAGYDLGPLGVNIGAPGCSGYILTADAFLDVSTVSPVGTCTTGPLTVPGTPSIIGLVLTTQAIAVLPPGIYNGNVNDIGGGNGLVTSNAVQQTYNPL